MAATALPLAAWMCSICAAISFVAALVWFASALTSLATTAKPLPASPARAASIVALSARRLVWEAMPLISATTFPILSVASARLWIVRSVCFTFSTALVAVFDESMIWRVISRIEAASSSAAHCPRSAPPRPPRRRPDGWSPPLSRQASERSPPSRRPRPRHRAFEADGQRVQLLGPFDLGLPVASRGVVEPLLLGKRLLEHLHRVGDHADLGFFAAVRDLDREVARREGAHGARNRFDAPPDAAGKRPGRERPDQKGQPEGHGEALDGGVHGDAGAKVRRLGAAGLERHDVIGRREGLGRMGSGLLIVIERSRVLGVLARVAEDLLERGLIGRPGRGEWHRTAPAPRP